MNTFLKELSTLSESFQRQELWVQLVLGAFVVLLFLCGMAMSRAAANIDND